MAPVTPAPRISRRAIIAGLIVVVPALGTVVALTRGVLQGFHAEELALFAVAYALGMLGITVGYHRLVTHLSFRTSDRMRVALTILGSMSAQGPILSWAADHRCHHVLSDKPGDPHSPHHAGGWRGFWYSHIGWMFVVETSWVRYVPDLMKDRRIYWVHRTYFWWVGLGLLLPTLAGWALIGGWDGALGGFLWGGLVRLFAVDQALWCVGSLAHMFGGRPFAARTADHSANNWWVALFSFGEGNQNNHHAYPASARHGLRWWQPDASWLVIRAMAALGLVWNVTTPPRDEVARAYARPRRRASGQAAT